METTQSMLHGLTTAINQCSDQLADPTSTRKQLMDANDKVLGQVSVCNASLKDFSEDERKSFDNLYDKATSICVRTRKFASLLR